ncbi:hypothetical protein [Amnibacterium endophyticum]|uniref:Uncharacterized protein n=1 Tax=Amnibacterium endophyticum TaxID=2109337 RepID=A0ABW4LBR3_9MICO
MRALLTAVPTPSPSPSLNVNPDSVTPGVVGFLAMLFITAAVVLLIVDMTRRVRRVRYRGELAERRDAAEGQDAVERSRDR